MLLLYCRIPRLVQHMARLVLFIQESLNKFNEMLIILLFFSVSPSVFLYNSYLD